MNFFFFFFFFFLCWCFFVFFLSVETIYRVIVPDRIIRAVQVKTSIMKTLRFQTDCLNKQSACSLGIDLIRVVFLDFTESVFRVFLPTFTQLPFRLHMFFHILEPQGKGWLCLRD